MESLKSFKKSYNIISFVYIVFGLVLLFWPAMSLKTICLAFGIITIIFGIVHLIGYFVKDNLTAVFRYDLVIGVIGVGIGIFVLIKPEFIISILPIAAGIFILFSSIMKFQNAMDLKRLEFERWWGVLGFAVTTTILGIVLIINPFKVATVLVQFLGISLVIDGCLNLVSVFILGKNVKRWKKQMEKGEDKEDDIIVDIVSEEDIPEDKNDIL